MPFACGMSEWWPARSGWATAQPVRPHGCGLPAQPLRRSVAPTRAALSHSGYNDPRSSQTVSITRKVSGFLCCALAGRQKSG